MSVGAAAASHRCLLGMDRCR